MEQRPLDRREFTLQSVMAILGRRHYHGVGLRRQQLAGAVAIAESEPRPRRMSPGR